ncbi:MAG TPA: rubrerythrin family protein [Bacteroidales bacterium]|nr:rubrerythrin family protein [Bacteroidales bacterium]
MKVLVRFVLFFMFTGLAVSCSSGPSKTIENLKTAFNGESTASAKYAAFAQKAEAEGFDTVAVMFRATSKAEAIHAANHKRVLENLGVETGDPVIEHFEVLSTSENLASGIKGESYEIDEMYPGFIATAEKEEVTDAVESFTYAIETEKKHKEFYESALEFVKEGSEVAVPVKWFVCPVCGNTYDEATLTDDCEFCMTPKSAYFVF